MRPKFMQGQPQSESHEGSRGATGQEQKQNKRFSRGLGPYQNQDQNQTHGEGLILKTGGRPRFQIQEDVREGKAHFQNKNIF